MWYSAQNFLIKNWFIPTFSSHLRCILGCLWVIKILLRTLIGYDLCDSRYLISKVVEYSLFEVKSDFDQGLINELNDGNIHIQPFFSLLRVGLSENYSATKTSFSASPQVSRVIEQRPIFLIYGSTNSKHNEPLFREAAETWMSLTWLEKSRHLSRFKSYLGQATL